MASTQEILQAVTGLNRTAQEAVPVLPNNGNPGGIYNMPRDVVQAQQATGVGATAPAPAATAAKPDPYAFLKASPAMESIKARTMALRGMLPQQQQQTTMPSSTMAPPVIASTTNQLPVLPLMRTM